MREMDALQKQIAAAETQIVEGMEQVEGVDKELEERADEISTLDEKRSAALAEFDSQLAAEKSEFEIETKHRAEGFATLPRGWLPSTIALLNAAATASQSQRSSAEPARACYMELRPQVQLEVKKGTEIITCENCARILYMPTREAEQQPDL